MAPPAISGTLRVEASAIVPIALGLREMVMNCVTSASMRKGIVRYRIRMGKGHDLIHQILCIVTALTPDMFDEIQL